MKKIYLSSTYNPIFSQFVWWETLAYIVVLILAAAMRFIDLDSRAMHHDESLHAFYSWNLANGFGYTHIPMMHGPFQFEANAAMFAIAGAGDYTARLLYAIAGTSLVMLPMLLRRHLTKIGALAASVILAVSPTMLYFSRFARNDILMAVWTLGIIVCMWRYIYGGKNYCLYVASILLALSFATKETTFLVILVLTTFLGLIVMPRNWAAIKTKLDFSAASPLDALLIIQRGIWNAYRRGVTLSQVSRPTSFLILLVTLSLPQWSAIISVFQDTVLLRWSNLILAAPVGSDAVGAPSGSGYVIAGMVVVLLSGLSVYWGFRWNWSIWWRCAAIFYAVWTLLYTTFFTNFMGGLGSGVWQSLGYWIVQQGVARGGQPWYYYFIITPVYEFLPLILGVIGAIYYRRKSGIFVRFLIFWTVTTFILFTIASEKMPWLLVGVTLPMVLLASRFIAGILKYIKWKEVITRWGILLILSTPALLVLLWRVLFFKVDLSNAIDILVVALFVLVGATTSVACACLRRRIGMKGTSVVMLLSLSVLLLTLTVRTGWVAAYKHGDVPVEMMVYTQTSPDVARLAKFINDSDIHEMKIEIDPTSGFSWPWVWYFRDRDDVEYVSPSLGDAGTDTRSLRLVHSDNLKQMSELGTGDLSVGERIPHRWWFPEDTYRGLTVYKFFSSFGNLTTWRHAMDYFIYRKGVKDRLGSEDAYLYVSPELPLSFSGSR